MKILFLDLFSGLSGDMFLGALLDVGVDLTQLERELGKLKLEGYHLHARKRSTWEIRGTKLEVHLAHAHAHDHDHDHDHAHDHGHESHHGHSHGHHDDHAAHHHHGAEAHHDEPGHPEQRTFADIKKLIETSRLSVWVRQKSVAVFQRIAEAEGKVHGCPPDKVHFHEVGAVDSIVDIVGACVALELLGKPCVVSAPVVEGSGFVDCAHGRFPVPAPATLEIFAARGTSLSQCDEPHEMVTPTGAALLAEFAETFGVMPEMRIQRVGYGLGTRQLRSRPNCVRVVLGEAVQAVANADDWESDRVAVLESNIDDLNPEILGAFVETALGQGALEVYYTPVTMKKCRPGVVLTVLCPEAQADQFTKLILRETSTFGVRCHLATRRKLKRAFTEVSTPWGAVTIKQGSLNGEVVQSAPEYESCRKLAEEKGTTVRQVYAAALSATAASKRVATAKKLKKR